MSFDDTTDMPGKQELIFPYQAVAATCRPLSSYHADEARSEEHSARLVVWERDLRERCKPLRSRRASGRGDAARAIKMWSVES
jgi:hypothetical protein